MKIFNLFDLEYNKFTEAVKSYLAKTMDSAKFKARFDNNTVFGQLINVINSVAQNIMLYIEDALVEQNKYTAQRKKSIYGLAQLSGYEPSSGKAAGAHVSMSFKPSNESNLNIILNNYTPLVCTQNGLTYNIVLPQEAIVLSADRDKSAKQLYVVQGKFETQSFVSRGGKYYTQNIKYNGNIDFDYVQLKVNGELWERVLSLYDMHADGKEYVLKTGYSGGVDVIFGNDVHGRALKDGDRVQITYLVHDGEMGNIDASKDTYFVFDKMITNIAGETINGNSIFNICLANDDSIVSGTDSETTMQVKQMIGYNTRSLVLSSPESYKAYINKFSFCGYNRTWSEQGSLIINSLIMKNYKQQLSKGKDYFDLHEEDFKLSEMQKSSIINSIKQSGNQLAGVTYNIYDPELCKYALYLYIKLKPNTKNTDYIKEHIRELVGSFFSDIQSDIFIPKSDIVCLIKTNIPEVDGVTAYFLSEKNELALQTHQYTNVQYKFNVETGNYDKTEKIVHLYEGENPNLGLDSHGNIYLHSDNQFPVLMGGWDFLSHAQQDGSVAEVYVADPLIITFE